MIHKWGFFIINLLLGSLCVAAGHITNVAFSDLIEKTTIAQKETASEVKDATRTQAAIQNYLAERPRIQR